MNYVEDLKEPQPSIACLSLLVDYFLPAHQIQKQFIYSNLKKRHREKCKFFYNLDMPYQTSNVISTPLFLMYL